MSEKHIVSEEETKRIQNAILQLLIEFDRICRKHGILYSLDGGTLLGAVREGGFIPWDDDGDVIIDRQEYDKLMAVLDEELDHDRFYYVDLDRTEEYRWGYGKLFRKDTKFVRYGQEFWRYDQGVPLDVFVCDNVPDNYIKRAICNFHSYLYRKFFYSEVGKRGKGIYAAGYRVMNKYPLSRLKRRYSKYIKKRNRKYTDWVKCLTFPAINSKHGYKREWYEDVTDIEFEGHTFLASRKRDEYLRFLYGNDYMTPPDSSKRKTHEASYVEVPDEVLINE